MAVCDCIVAGVEVEDTVWGKPGCGVVVGPALIYTTEMPPPLSHMGGRYMARREVAQLQGDTKS